MGEGDEIKSSAEEVVTSDPAVETGLIGAKNDGGSEKPSSKRRSSRRRSSKRESVKKEEPKGDTDVAPVLVEEDAPSNESTRNSKRTSKRDSKRGSKRDSKRGSKRNSKRLSSENPAAGVEESDVVPEASQDEVDAQVEKCTVASDDADPEEDGAVVKSSAEKKVENQDDDESQHSTRREEEDDANEENEGEEKKVATLETEQGDEGSGHVAESNKTKTVETEKSIPAKSKKKLDPKKQEIAELMAKNMFEKSTGANAKALQKSQQREANEANKKPSLLSRLFCRPKSLAGGPTEDGKGTGQPPQKEDIKEKIARQARLAGGGEYMTGGATIHLGKEIQNSKIATKMNKRKEELAKRKAAEDKIKAQEAAKLAATPKKKQTLNSFLEEEASKKGKEKGDEATLGGDRKSEKDGSRLTAFLAKSES